MPRNEDRHKNVTSRWLNLQAAADYCGCSIRTIQALTKSGRLPVSYAIGPRSPRICRFELDKFLGAEQRTQEKHPAEDPGVRLAAG
jgi:excisionase family DNA binding protein